MIKKWLRKNKWRFSHWRWYRKWYGGKWNRWVTSLSMGPVWLPADEYCGCGMRIIKTENWES